MTRTLLRLIVSTYCWLTAAYAWLAAAPFSYQEFIRPRMFGTGPFQQWHVVLYWAWLVFALADVGGAFARGRLQRRLAWTFAAVWTLAGVWMTARPMLPTLADDHRSLILGVIALLPLAWLSAIDHAAAGRFLRNQRESAQAADPRMLDGRLLVSALGSAAFVTILYAGLAPILMRGEFEPDLLTLGLSLGLAWNLAYHMLIFCGAFCVLAVARRVAVRAPFAVQYAVTFAIVAAALSAATLYGVCDALGLEGAWRVLVAAACGITITATWGGLRARRWADRDTRLTTGLDVFFGPPASASLHVRHLVPFLIVGAVAYALPLASRIIDWDFLLLKSGVFVLWIIVFDRIFQLTPLVSIGDLSVTALCLLPVAAYVAHPAIEARARHWLRDPQFDLSHVLDRYGLYSPSFRLVDGWLRQRPAGLSPFQRFVRENSGLAKLDVNPVSLDFVPGPGDAPFQPAPPMFLFVIDSLRPDYLSPYNPAVSFTPRIGEFAADSVVFRNALTKYGGTGLSLPAIWSGAVGVHKQYVTPFWPMNTLEKLLAANRYRRVMSIDVIMEQLLRPAEGTIQLDRGVRTMDYELCRTLEELEAKFPSDGPDRPVFGYSLPQDLHVSNIMTASVPPGETYPGFHPPYAARVHRIDRCFGAFVDFLKRRDLYDRSLIIVTSDHGEMLGEEGRWGHAYYMFPPVLQVPLIMHLPRAARQLAGPDTGAVSFSTDIAPTVYAALGYRPRAANGVMGEPLIGADRVDAWTRRRRDFVASASYSAVYAVIRSNGRRVYIFDAIKGEDFAYLQGAAGRWKKIPVTDGLRTTAQRLIREHIDEIRRVYRMPRGR